MKVDYYYDGTETKSICRGISVSILVRSSTWYEIQASFKLWLAAIIVSSAHLSDDTRFCCKEKSGKKKKITNHERKYINGCVVFSTRKILLFFDQVSNGRAIKHVRQCSQVLTSETPLVSEEVDGAESVDVSIGPGQKTVTLIPF